MTHRIFISSYRKDFKWLEYFLKSCKKFCRGFHDRPVVAVPEEDLSLAAHLGELAHFVRRPDVLGRGMMSSQRAMLEADRYCPGTDFVHLLGSDNFVAEPYVAEDFLRDGRPLMYRIPYSHWKESAPIDHCHPTNWQKGIRLVFHTDAEFEYMNRKPNLYPRPLYELTRMMIEEHMPGVSWWDYVQHAEKTLFSEQNVLGFVAERWAPHLYHFVPNTNYKGSAFETAYIDQKQPILAFWSWGGLDRPICAGTTGETPRQVIERILGEKVT